MTLPGRSEPFCRSLEQARLRTTPSLAASLSSPMIASALHYSRPAARISTLIFLSPIFLSLAEAITNRTGFHGEEDWQRASHADRQFIYEKTAMGHELSPDQTKEAFCDYAVAAWLAPAKAQDKAPHAWAQLRHWELVP